MSTLVGVRGGCLERDTSWLSILVFVWILVGGWVNGSCWMMVGLEVEVGRPSVFGCSYVCVRARVYVCTCPRM